MLVPDRQTARRAHKDGAWIDLHATNAQKLENQLAAHGGAGVGLSILEKPPLELGVEGDG